MNLVAAAVPAGGTGPVFDFESGTTGPASARGGRRAGRPGILGLLKRINSPFTSLRRTPLDQPIEALSRNEAFVGSHR